MTTRREIRQALANIKPNVVDRVVGYFDPVRGAERLKSRMGMALAGGYTGASKTRRSMLEWHTGGGSADADTLWDLPTLRERSSDLVRNNAMAGGAIHTVVTRTVGTGLAMQPAIRGDLLSLTPDEVEAWHKFTQARFSMWAMSKDADVARRLNFYQSQDLSFRSALEKGDSFCLLRIKEREAGNNRLALQLIEADRITNKDNAIDSLKLAGGIEQDEDGAVVNYHIRTTHPGDINRAASDKVRWNIVPVYGVETRRRNVLHLCRTLRIGQRRGVPYLAPVIELLKQIDRYSEAELMAAVVSGLFTVFVKSADGEGANVFSNMGAETGAKVSDKDVKLASGAIVDLADGESIETANPGRPNANFEPFFLAIVRQIGVGLELPFEVLIKHFNSSYSAARAALLDAWLFIRCRRDWLATEFCQPIYEAWLEEEVANGYIDAPGFFDDPLIRYAYCCCTWVGDGPGSIDPYKEVMAAAKRVELEISTRDKEAMLHDGGNFDDNHTQLAREARARVKDGTLPVVLAPIPPPQDESIDENNDTTKARASELSA